MATTAATAIREFQRILNFDLLSRERVRLRVDFERLFSTLSAVKMNAGGPAALVLRLPL